MGRDGGERDGGEQVVEDGGFSRLNRIFGSLSHPRRRGVLYYLREEGQADIEDLARVIAGWEQDVDAEEVSTESRERVQADLRHIHLPKLEDYRLVEYDPRSGTVSYSYAPELLDDIIDFAQTIEEPP